MLREVVGKMAGDAAEDIAVIVNEGDDSSTNLKITLQMLIFQHPKCTLIIDVAF